ncbi:MAG: type II toxin-antitoxin system PemK/MazF family toxin [Pseudomonadota bacterium]|jgi:mRNA interferase MazF
MFEAGSILLIPFPFTDMSSSKRRPVLALTAPDAFGDFIALPVTSRAHHEHTMPLSNADLQAGQLPVESWIRLDRVVTLSAGLVVKVIGKVGTEVLERARNGLCDTIG